ncbi:MAG: hypothetical protein KTR25_08195 [Myxococcales bacterium]|nr:hypothetical protein [Myxococcales bacterium]
MDTVCEREGGEVASTSADTQLKTSGGEEDSPWGGPPRVEDENLRRLCLQVQQDFESLIEELQWDRGPLRRMVVDGQSFLSDLRKTFLRHHRRLVVHIRAEGGIEFAARVRSELAELADAFRVHVLSRVSKASHEAWSPDQLAQAIDRVLGRVGRSVEARLEPTVYQRQPGAGFKHELRRWILLLNQGLRSLSGNSEPRRTIALRDFLAWHIYRSEGAGLEGMSVLLVQAESHLERRARNLFELVSQAFEDLIQSPDELAESLGQLRSQVEDELVLAEQELVQFAEDIRSRANLMLTRALHKAKEELPLIGTLHLHNKRRVVTRRLLVLRTNRLADLSERLAEVRESACGGYILLGLRLEVAAYQARVTRRIESETDDLERNVRGRSVKQIVRVRSEVENALALLRKPEDEKVTTDVSLTASAEFSKVLQSLKWVVRDAQRAAHQMIEQLNSADALHSAIEAVLRDARGLTNYYQVPLARLAHTEWTLPPTAPVTELPLATIVADFIDTNVAPELLDIATQAGGQFKAILDVFHEVERVVSLGGGQLEGDDALVREAPELGETYSVLENTFQNALEQLVALESPAELWARDFARSLRSSFRKRLQSLDEGLTEGELASTAASARQTIKEPRGAQFWDRWGRFSASLAAFRRRSGRRFKAVVGAGRMAKARETLGLPLLVEEPERCDESKFFESPTEKVTLAPFYRRLFAGQGTWAGDALESRAAHVAMARRILSGEQGGFLRTVVVVGTEGSGRRALLSSLTRGDRFGQLRSIAFTEPAAEQEVHVGLEELGQGQLIVVTGLSWLVSASDCGFSGLRALVDGILADEGRNAFLVEADALAWSWASAIAPLGDVFAGHIEVPQLGAREMEEIIMERHRLSGLELSFGANHHDELDRSHYFSQLHEASDGLLQLGLLYWLASIEVFDEPGGRVQVGTIPRSPHVAMQSLGEDTLHPLYLIARQGWMTAGILAEMLGRRDTEGAALLSRLTSMGLLERTSRGHYIVCRHLAGVLNRVLRERGWA